jgi:hypothetical protein
VLTNQSTNGCACYKEGWDEREERRRRGREGCTHEFGLKGMRTLRKGSNKKKRGWEKIRGILFYLLTFNPIIPSNVNVGVEVE